MLITRLGHVGDCVFTLPLACAIKDQNPQAFIAWAVEEPAKQYLVGHRAVDELVVVPPAYRKNPKALMQVRAKLKALRCDLSIDPQMTVGSSLSAWLSAAPRRIGIAPPHRHKIAALLQHEIADHGHQRN